MSRNGTNVRRSTTTPAAYVRVARADVTDMTQVDELRATFEAAEEVGLDPEEIRAGPTVREGAAQTAHETPVCECREPLVEALALRIEKRAEWFD